MSDTAKDRAIHSLWEKHCAGYRQKQPWPPSDREVREEMERDERNSGWDDSAPGS